MSSSSAGAGSSAVVTERERVDIESSGVKVDCADAQNRRHMIHTRKRSDEGHEVSSTAVMESEILSVLVEPKLNIISAASATLAKVTSSAGVSTASKVFIGFNPF